MMDIKLRFDSKINEVTGHMKTMSKFLLTVILTLFSLGLWGVAGVRFSIQPEDLKAGDKGNIKVVMTIPKDMHQTYIPGENDYFYLNAVHPSLVFGATVYPAPQEKKEGNEWIYKGTITIYKPFTVKAAIKPGTIKIQAEFAYNICFDTGSCEPPETINQDLTLKINPAESGKEADVAPDQVIEEAILPEGYIQEDAVAQKKSEAASADAANPAKGSNNIWQLLIMAFLGGLILNIMPCVLPVLSIKAMSIVKQAHEDKKQIMRHSFAYTMGILTCFLIMATVIIIIKMTGEAVGWGFQFQNTGFVIFLTSLIFIFALSLFDVFIIQVPGMTAATKAGNKGGTHGSFFSGMFAVMLATPCSAPMLGTALGFAFSQSPVMILIFFMLIGLGLALPFILLGLNPKWMKVIPRPGEWMNIFKEIMGFLLIATVIWLLNVVFQQNGGEYLIRVLSYLVFQGFAVWLYGRFVRHEHSQTTQWVFSILAMIILASSVMIILPGKAVTPQSKTEQSAPMTGWEGWQTFSPALVDELVARNEPVFVDFGAKWCMTCISNEKTVILTDVMKTAFSAKKVQLVHGDFTKKNPDMQAFMKKFGRAGVPFYVLYIPGKEPKLFPEIITIPMLKKALDEIK